MDLKDRFFGRDTPQIGGPPVANNRLADPPGFALLFPSPPALDADALTAHLREYHPELAAATAELLKIPPQPNTPPDAAATTIGLIGWGRHVVKVVGLDAPMPASVVERTVVPAHFDPQLKEEAYRHAAHVLVFYAGYEPDPLEQHVALAAAAAGLTRFGALVAINETARTAVPSVALLPHAEDDGDTMHTLRTFPLPLFYAGFVKMEVEGHPGVWMRTYGCHVFKLPDFAFRSEGHGHGEATFNLFANLLAHLRETDRPFSPGDTLNVGEGMFLRLRDRTEDEWFLQSEGRMLVAEPVNPEEANR